MAGILERVSKLPALRELRQLLSARGRAAVVGCAGSGPAAVAAWLALSVRTHALAVCAGVEEAEEFAEDVNLFHDGLACHFPALEVLPGDVERPSEAILRARLSVLRHLSFGDTGERGDQASDIDYLEPTPRTRIVATSVTALLQPTCSPDDLREGSLSIAVGEEAEPGRLVEWLVDNGYQSAPQVQLSGQYCLRGGILDIYSHGAPEPVRVEFFGDKVDSIRTFDPFSQLSTGRIQRCQVTVPERGPGADGASSGSLLDFLEPDAAVVIVGPERLWRRAETVYEQTERRDLLRVPAEVERVLAQRPHVVFRSDEEGADGAVRITCTLRDSFGPELDSTLVELERVCNEYEETRVYCFSPAEAERFEALLKDSAFGATERLRIEVGRLNHGALFPDAGLALVPHHRLFHRYRQRRLISHMPAARPVAAAEELEVGGLVVHIQHGIGKFLGTRLLEQDGRTREHLEIEFADKVRVYVPADRIEMVHRYIGVGAHRPELSKLRGVTWQKAKKRAEEAVEDLAAELLELQAIRETQPGIAAPADSEWLREFESEFPYEETDDQLRGIEDVKRDMQAPRPMDRLICGDVGYGKTEIAMRAAFLAVLGGRQVAVLVPTTVLAQQHFRTFGERMADYPVNIEMLSRFRTGSETQHVLEGMASGTVDIVIGTHKLLQSDVAFKNLGLVIIDEEQRFGVEHKERLKQMRATVDVLTLTATPIPRTLHMSLIGLREISALQTPPRDRQAIETRVMQFNPEVLRRAVLRELNREGQIFMIHNRVRTIKDFALQVKSLVPEASVAVAHGQMPEHALAEAMDSFTEGEVDVLISTTIVENGVDIPNANTMIIDRADILGLAEMHQLRGRVGRYIHKAYAYFFKPASRPVTPEAEKRLEVIERYSQLGAGFDIALRDLEIRGAGNILGPAQSGHIAAVGYNLYCRLLARAAARLKGEPIEEPPAVNVNIGLDAFLPEDYVQTPRQRMDFYRQVNRATELADLRRARRALEDRYGPLPPDAVSLFAEAEVRILAARAGIDSIHTEDGRLHFGVRDGMALQKAFKVSPVAPRLVSADLAVLDDGFPREDPVELCGFLRDLLRGR